MSDLTKLFVFLTTAKVNDANTDSRIRLVYDDVMGKKEFELGGQPHDERERGRTDLYEFSFTINVEIDDVRPDHFKIVATEGDAWLPSSIFIVGKSNSNEFKVLVGNENWPKDAWFSTQTSDANGRAEKARLLDRTGTPTAS